MRPVRMGVIGVGSMGFNHARVCSGLPQVDLVALVDSDADRVRNVAEQFSTRAFTQPRDILHLVDAVTIVAPTAYHYDLTRLFLENGVHVLVEKPITVRSQEGRELDKMAQERGLILQVGHLERFNPAVLKLQELVRKPVSLEFHRLSPRTARNLDVSISWDLMIHDLDILLSLLGEDIVDIQASGVSVYSKFEDIASVQLRSQSGVMAHLVASRNSAERSRGVKVTEADGRVIWVDFIAQSVSVATIDDEGKAGVPKAEPVETAEPLKSELAHFAQCILEHRVPLVSASDGVRALELAELVRSHMTVSRVS